MHKELELFYELADKLCSQVEYNRRWSVCSDAQIYYRSEDKAGFGYIFIFDFCGGSHFEVAYSPSVGLALVSAGGTEKIFEVSDYEEDKILEYMNKLIEALDYQLINSLRIEIKSI